MFDELTKYKHHDHFFFKETDSLSKVCNAPTDKGGVYLIWKLSKSRVELIYIGSSGQKAKDGTLKVRIAGLGGIKDRLVNGKQFGNRRSVTFPIKMLTENIDALDIYWYVTYDENHKDFPGEIETMLLKRFHELYGRLPEWNKEF